MQFKSGSDRWTASRTMNFILLLFINSIATFPAVQGRSIAGCSPDEELNICGNHCELTCDVITGIPRPCPPICGPPACVCKEYTYRLNGSCVPFEVCEQNAQEASTESVTVDWQGNNTIPHGEIFPIPCSGFPCPEGYTCSEGQEVCTADGDCTVTATECVQEGHTPTSEISASTPGTTIYCVNNQCPVGFVCSEGETVCTSYDDCSMSPPICTPVGSDGTTEPELFTAKD